MRPLSDAAYDSEGDSLYVYLSDAEVVRTQALDGLWMSDWAADGRVVGIEFLDVSDGVDLQDVPAAATVAQLISDFHFPVLA